MLQHTHTVNANGGSGHCPAVSVHRLQSKASSIPMTQPFGSATVVALPTNTFAGKPIARSTSEQWAQKQVPFCMSSATVNIGTTQPSQPSVQKPVAASIGNSMRHLPYDVGSGFRSPPVQVPPSMWPVQSQRFVRQAPQSQVQCLQSQPLRIKTNLQASAPSGYVPESQLQDQEHKPTQPLNAAEQPKKVAQLMQWATAMPGHSCAGGRSMPSAPLLMARKPATSRARSPVEEPMSPSLCSPQTNMRNDMPPWRRRPAHYPDEHASARSPVHHLSRGSTSHGSPNKLFRPSQEEEMRTNPRSSIRSPPCHGPHTVPPMVRSSRRGSFHEAASPSPTTWRNCASLSAQAAAELGPPPRRAAPAHEKHRSGLCTPFENGKASSDYSTEPGTGEIWKIPTSGQISRSSFRQPSSMSDDLQRATSFAHKPDGLAPGEVPSHRAARITSRGFSPTPGSSSEQRVLSVMTGDDHWDKLKFHANESLEAQATGFLREHSLNIAFVDGLVAQMRQMVAMRQLAASVDIVDLI